MLRLALLSGAVLCASTSLQAAEPDADWPQFLGPRRDAHAPSVSTVWPAEGPRVIWRKQVGAGYSGPVVAAGRLILFHRTADQERLEAFDPTTAESLWHFGYASSYRDFFGSNEGPRSTPTVSGNRVYSLGAEGMASCIDLASGKLVWKLDTKSTLGARPGYCGVAPSPLVRDGRVWLVIGGSKKSAVVALDAADGSITWQGIDDEAACASPMVVEALSPPLLLVPIQSRFVGIDFTKSKVAVRDVFRPPASATVTAATPVISGSEVFISACYGLGARLLNLESTPARVVWQSDESLSCHYATPVLHDGHLYGFHGRADFPPGCALRCVDWKTGTVRWSRDGFGEGTVILAGDHLLMLNETGELVLAAASPLAYREVSRVQILGSNTRAHPALAGGILYARGKDTLASVDLRTSSPNGD